MPSYIKRLLSYFKYLLETGAKGMSKEITRTKYNALSLLWKLVVWVFLQDYDNNLTTKSGVLMKMIIYSSYIFNTKITGWIEMLKYQKYPIFKHYFKFHQYYFKITFHWFQYYFKFKFELYWILSNKIKSWKNISPTWNNLEIISNTNLK